MSRAAKVKAAAKIAKRALKPRKATGTGKRNRLRTSVLASQGLDLVILPAGNDTLTDIRFAVKPREEGPTVFIAIGPGNVDTVAVNDKVVIDSLQFATMFGATHKGITVKRKLLHAFEPGDKVTIASLTCARVAHSGATWNQEQKAEDE